MEFSEFAAWLRREVEEGHLLQSQMNDLLVQRTIFDNSRSLLESEFRMRAVGFVAGQRQVADSVGELLDGARKSFPSQMLYFETIGYRLFG